MNRIFRYAIFYLLIFLVIIGIFGTFNGDKVTTKEMNYYEFFEALDSKKVESITLQPDNNVYVIRGTMKGAEEGEDFTVNILQNNQTAMDDVLNIKSDYPEVKILEAPETSGWVSFFTGIIPFVIIIILFFFSYSYFCEQ